MSRTKLTETQIDRVHKLAEPRPDGRRLSARRIANMIEAEPGAVAWQMYRCGLKVKRRSGQREPYVRSNGTVVRPFGDDEDAFIVAERKLNRSYAEIAAAVQARFGYPRRARAVKIRLIMLAGFAAASEERDLAA